MGTVGIAIGVDQLNRVAGAFGAQGPTIVIVIRDLEPDFAIGVIENQCLPFVREFADILSSDLHIWITLAEISQALD